jgi:hypothetical protein
VAVVIFILVDEHSPWQFHADRVYVEKYTGQQPVKESHPRKTGRES